LDTLKKNQFSIPRIVSILSQTRSIKQLDTSIDLVSHHKLSGNAFISLTGGRGLTLFEATPKIWRHRFIEIFKRNPKTVLGVTKSHLVIHTLKILDKYGAAAIVLPFVVLAMAVSFLPTYLVWAILIGSLGYLVGLIILKMRNRNNKKRSIQIDNARKEIS
jgi:hypothetical protein